MKQVFKIRLNLISIGVLGDRSLARVRFFWQNEERKITLHLDLQLMIIKGNMCRLMSLWVAVDFLFMIILYVKTVFHIHLYRVKVFTKEKQSSTRYPLHEHMLLTHKGEPEALKEAIQYEYWRESQSKLYKFVTLSMNEIEYIAIIEASQELLIFTRTWSQIRYRWIRNVLKIRSLAHKKVHMNDDGSNMITKS
ncbi:hypothetical protein RJ641_015494 [Dillenia turbinata]|uniref:Uncharacterized protein n=1 Tax=Dillenia turbinata TaxID=194707 RepID=A0AAN8Z150_9MAGN